jgi:hypothetical protein
MRWLNAVAWFANFVGMACGLYVLFVAIDRNHQGEYINDAGALDFGYAFQMFLAAYLAGAIAAAIAIAAAAAAIFLVLGLARWPFRRSA